MIFSLEQKGKETPALLSAQGITVTYGELCSQAVQMGKIMQKRSLLFCMCENMPGAVVGYIAAMENQTVPLLLDAKLNQEPFDTFYHTYEPAYLWAPADRETACTCHVREKVYEAYGYCLWKTEYPCSSVHPKLGLLLATSGSTGSPKLVRLSRNNVEANAAAICEYLKLDADQRPITTLPMQYTYGLSIINSHLLAGACILMTTESYVQSGFWELFAKEQATSLSGVPYTYEILKKMHMFRRPLPTIQTLTQAGGKLPQTLQREVGKWAKSQGISFYVMYGQTEATARMSYLPPEKCLEKIGSIGIPIPGGSFQLVDETGAKILEPGQVGELVYTGENVSLGYAETKQDLLLGDVRGGVLYTGDMAKRDAEGFYYIVGRRKRFLKIFGVRVSLDACEQFFRERYEGVEVACTGEDNHMKIYMTDLQTAQRAAEELAEYLQLQERALEGIYLPEIPKNEAGKIQYQRLDDGKV